MSETPTLPQLGGKMFLTDGGIETDLIFNRGIDLPYFAAFDLLKDESGRQALRDYFEPYLEFAREKGTGFILESPTWRASADWGALMGYDADAVREANRQAIALMKELKAAFETEASPVVISGCVGPRGDGYQPGNLMTAEEAQRYHSLQCEAFAAAGVDLITGITMNNVPESVGLALAAREAGVPCVISFTVETDGRLPTGDSLAEAIGAVDEATGGYPAYYMLNCAHPTHFSDVFEDGGDWASRLRGLRANASHKSHAELDEATELDDGDPRQLGSEYAALRRVNPNLVVLGGCCGTDFRHVEQIYLACS